MSGKFSKSLMLLARDSVETICVRRISLPGNLVKLTCSTVFIYLFIFFMIFWYGIFYSIKFGDVY